MCRSWDWATEIHRAATGILTAMETSVMALFEETGAYLHGHFRLTSGLHSNEYLQCAKVLANPAYAERLGQELAAQVKTLLAGVRPDVVIAPAIGGIVIGHEVARAFRARSLFTERDPGVKRHDLCAAVLRLNPAKAW
jgi:orotate phosphoribosyltransferase